MRVRLPIKLTLVGIAAAVLYTLAVLAGPISFQLWNRSDAVTTALQAATLDLPACRTSPSTWVQVEDPFAITAADPAGRSWSARTPDLPPEALALPVGASLLIADPDRPFLGRTVLSTGDPACPYLIARHVSPAPLPLLAEPLLLGSFVGLSAVLVLLYGLAIRPLTFSLRQLSHAAEQLGTDTFDLSPDPVEDDIGRLSRALAQAHQRITTDAAQLVAQRDAIEDHLSAIAHDVRTPLTALSLSLDSLHQRAPSDETRHALQECLYLTLLIDNLNQSSRLRAAVGKQRTLVDLVQIAEHLRVRFTRIADAHGAQFSVGIEARSIPLLGDPVGIERAVGNLIYNAIVHSPGEVLLMVEGEREHFVLSVWDNGPGMPENPRPSARRSGLGLGLRITRDVVAAHGWTLRHERTDAGSAVHIEGDAAPTRDG